MTTQGAQLSIAYGEEQRLRRDLEETRAALEREIVSRRRLERAIIEATDNERRRLAQVLHDTICQSLGGIALLGRVILRRLESAGREEAAEVAEMGRVIDEATREVHSVVRWLRPAPVDGQDVIAALAELTPALFQGIPCEFRCPSPVVLADPLAATQLVRIAYQAVSDALQHPGVQRIVVSLTAQDGRVTLMVRDDGLASEELPSAAALAAEELLRLRARALGATLTISSQAEQGNTILCKLPKSN
jgi:signal transduction histidine kinase